MATRRVRWTAWVVFALASTSALAGPPVRIVSEGKAEKDWVPSAPLAAPAYPPGAEDIGGVCVNIGYYLGEGGVPSEFSLLKSWSKPAARPG